MQTKASSICSWICYQPMFHVSVGDPEGWQQQLHVGCSFPPLLGGLLAPNPPWFCRTGDVECHAMPSAPPHGDRAAGGPRGDCFVRGIPGISIWISLCLAHLHFCYVPFNLIFVKHHKSWWGSLECLLSGESCIISQCTWTLFWRMGFSTLMTWLCLAVEDCSKL